MEQTIMLGFSDGTKDGGYLKANWEIFNVKERLSRVCAEYGVRVVFFDGRGGPPARGGGKTHRFYASQGANIANHEIHLTIQGQTITSIYGTDDQFLNNCEQLITAGINNSLFLNEKTHIAPQQRKLLDELALLSFQKYTALKQHPKFVPYLEKISPLKYYGKTNIGSRPSRRGKSEELSLSDLRAIPFVGSWSQLKQNVPGYFGLGSALNELKKSGRLQEAKALFADMPFFRALLLNSMMAVKKTFFPLTAYMKEDPDFGDFWQMLYDEYQLSLELMLEVSGFEELMQEEPVSSSSVSVREEIVLPLITIQQHALQKVLDGEGATETYEKLVTRSFFGSINASRNSA
jgi:phosphoenolpyruvate carboxylase